eukprot:scaffold14918_cov133-Skeletonema_marinoi.AAC.1
MSVTNSMSPEDLAQSLRQNAWTFNKKDAPKEALRPCCRYLQNLGYEATHMSLKSGKEGDAPTGHGQYHYDRPDQKLYCKQCSTHNKPTLHQNNGVFKGTVIAVLSITKVNQEEDLYQLTVCKLYPHYCRNIEPIRRTTGTDPGGWATINMDFESIVGNTFQYILNQLQQMQSTDLFLYQSKFGKAITSGCSDHHQPHDVRYQIPIHHRHCLEEDEVQREIDDHYMLNDPDFREEYKHLRARLALFLANKLGIAREIQGFTIPYYPDNVPKLSNDVTQSHLSIEQGSIIFAGVPLNNDDSGNTGLVPQIPHVDFAANDEDEYISQNESLSKLTHPGTMLIPLDSPRTILVHVTNGGDTVTHGETVKKGDLFWLDGTVVHSGDTYNLGTETPFDLRPCLHMYLNSSLHECDLSLFTTCRTTANNKMETYAPVCSRYPALTYDINEVIEQLDVVKNKFDAANEAGAVNENDRLRISYKLRDMAAAISEKKSRKREEAKHHYNLRHKA